MKKVQLLDSRTGIFKRNTPSTSEPDALRYRSRPTELSR
jgi:hypothetical protein